MYSRFYAPWCGHCQNLKPAYEKAAKSLDGIAKVAAVNCDEEENKAFCGSMDVKGFPTLKIVRPGKKAGRPTVEDYQGPRTAKGIVESVKDKIPSHVKRVTDKDLDGWLTENNSSAKAILFSEKGVTSALLKAVAIDFLGSISVAQIRSKEAAAVSLFGVTSYPALVLLPGGTKDPVVYSGEMKKAAIVDFLSQAATPNPDPAPASSKSKSKASSKDAKESSKASSKFSKASSSHRSDESASVKASQTAETLEENNNPTESPNPQVATDDTQKPIQVPEVAPQITTLDTTESLQQSCLTSKSGVCILLLAPSAFIQTTDSPVSKAASALSEIHHKHAKRGAKLFPFYTVPASASSELRTALGLSDDTLEIVAINAKRAWVKRYSGISDVSHNAIDDWVDSIRMGEGKKEKLAESVIVEAAEKQAPPADKQSPPAAEKPEEKVQMTMEELTDEQYEALMKAHNLKPLETEEQAAHDEL